MVETDNPHFFTLYESKNSQTNVKPDNPLYYSDHVILKYILLKDTPTITLMMEEKVRNSTSEEQEN